jgi:hypothetical protein
MVAENFLPPLDVLMVSHSDSAQKDLIEYLMLGLACVYAESRVCRTGNLRPLILICPSRWYAEDCTRIPELGILSDVGHLFSSSLVSF